MLETLQNSCMWFFGVVIIWFIYFLPTLIALKKVHDNKASIFICNFFLGWTFLGWIVALMWACIGSVEEIKNNIKVYKKLFK